MSFTTYATAIAGSILTAAFWNQQIRDNGNVIVTSIETSTGRLSGELKNFREEVTTVTFSATPTFDCSLSNAFKITLTNNVTSISVTNLTASKATPVTIHFIQDGTGGRTVAIPAGWKSTNGIAVSVATGANKHTILTLYTDDGGTTVFASTYVVNA